jgi:hypothetical protein
LRQIELCDGVHATSPVTPQVALSHLWAKLAFRSTTEAHFSSILQ